MRIALALLVCALATGCGGSSVTSWTPLDATLQKKCPQTAGLPERWLVYGNKAKISPLAVTRHGPDLDVIKITAEQKLPVKMRYTELSISADMRLYEVAEIVMNNLRVTPGVFDLLMEELAPAEIDGKEAFRLALSYSLESGIRKRCLIFGTLHDGGKRYTELALYAHEDYYFDAVIGEFLGMVKGARVR
jgi:hypothetical protein